MLRQVFAFVIFLFAATVAFALQGIDLTQTNTGIRGGLGNTFSVSGVNFNSGTTDTAITINIPQQAWGYTVTAFKIGNASHSLTTATLGLFTATAGSGTAIVTDSAITVTTGTLGSANSTQSFTINSQGTIAYNNTTLYARVGTAEMTAATGDVNVEVRWIY